MNLRFLAPWLVVLVAGSMFVACGGESKEKECRKAAHHLYTLPDDPKQANMPARERNEFEKLSAEQKAELWIKEWCVGPKASQISLSSIKCRIKAKSRAEFFACK